MLLCLLLKLCKDDVINSELNVLLMQGNQTHNFVQKYQNSTLNKGPLIVFYRTNVAIRPNISSGMLKCSIVGIIVSLKWLCCPSMFRPIVGPSAVSDTGDPASPSAPAVAISANIALVDIPNCVHIGTYIAEIIGTVENDDPILQ